MVSATPISSSSSFSSTPQFQSRSSSSSSSSSNKVHSNGRIKYGFTYQQLEPLFHLPLVQAAQRLDTCTATLKRACRRIGIRSWPHRQVRSALKRALEAEQAGRISPTKRRSLQPTSFKMETLVALLKMSTESPSRPISSTNSFSNITSGLTKAPPLPKLPSLKRMLARNEMFSTTRLSSSTYTTSKWKCCGVSNCTTTLQHQVPVRSLQSTTTVNPQVLHTPVSFYHGITYSSHPPLVTYRRNVPTQSFA